MPRKELYILISIVLLSFSSFAQYNNSTSIFLEGNYQYGFIWQHDPSLSDIIDGNINIFQLNIGKETYGESYWDQLYRYPDRGLGIYYADLGNSIKLGCASAIYGYVNIPLIVRRKFQVKYHIFAGLAHLNQNIAIGSTINCYVDFSLDTRIKLGEQIYLVNAFGATHFSNGAIKKPNLGLNLFSYRLGIFYNFNETKPQKITQILPEIEMRNYIVTTINTGIKELSKKANEKYTIFSGIIDYQRRLGYKYKVGIGVDIFYDESLLTIMSSETNISISNTEIMRYGLHVGTDVRIYNLVLAFNIGTYLYANYDKDGLIYQRVAVRYLLSETLFANVSLKTSKGVADFVEWGIGYQFKW